MANAHAGRSVVAQSLRYPRCDVLIFVMPGIFGIGCKWSVGMASSLSTGAPFSPPAVHRHLVYTSYRESELNKRDLTTKRFAQVALSSFRLVAYKRVSPANAASGSLKRHTDKAFVIVYGSSNYWRNFAGCHLFTLYMRCLAIYSGLFRNSRFGQLTAKSSERLALYLSDDARLSLPYIFYIPW